MAKPFTMLLQELCDKEHWPQPVYATTCRLLALIIHQDCCCLIIWWLQLLFCGSAARFGPMAHAVQGDLAGRHQQSWV